MGAEGAWEVQNWASIGAVGRQQASFIRGGGGILDRTHPPRPPPLIILWGAFFVNQIEAKALSRFRHPQRVTHQKLHNTRV